MIQLKSRKQYPAACWPTLVAMSQLRSMIISKSFFFFFLSLNSNFLQFDTFFFVLLATTTHSFRSCHLLQKPQKESSTVLSIPFTKLTPVISLAIYDTIIHHTPPPPPPPGTYIISVKKKKNLEFYTCFVTLFFCYVTTRVALVCFG